MAGIAKQNWWIIVLAAAVAAAITVPTTLWVQSQRGAKADAAEHSAGHAPGEGAAAPGGEGPPPAMVRIAAASVETLQERFPVIGRLEEVRHTTVAAEVSGKVLSIVVSEGDVVTGGKTVLAEIDGVWARLDSAAAEAQVAAAQAQLDQATRDFQRLEALLATNSARPREVEDARLAVQHDQANLDSARAARDRAAEHVRRLKVLAPFDGVVVRKHLEAGEWVSPGTEVAEVISHGQIHALLHVPERLVNQVTVGEEVELLVDALGHRAMGKVVSVTPSGNNPARTFPVQVVLSDDGGRLKPGMSVTAMLALGEQAERVTVPREAVIFRPDGAVVWMAMPMTPPLATPGAAAPAAADGAPPLQAMSMPVRVLFSEGPRYAIELVSPPPGVALGPQTSVVIEGAERLFPTQPLTVVYSSSSPAATQAATPAEADRAE